MRSKDDKAPPTSTSLAPLVSPIATNLPNPDGLGSDALQVAGDTPQVKLNGLDWSNVCETWLSDQKSARTVEVYRRALGLFQDWCVATKTDPLRLDAAGADDFILHLLSSHDTARESVRTAASALSSLYSWLTRRSEIRNCFLGSKVLRTAVPRAKPAVPDRKTVEIILESVSQQDAAAVAVLAYLGIPIGSLPSLTIAGTHFETVFKGRRIAGPVTAAVCGWLTRAGLVLARPFADRSDRQLTMRLRGQFAALVRKQVLDRQYSARDLQDYWVMQTWNQSRDLVAIRDRLGHSCLDVTDRCLYRLELVPRSG